MVGYVGRMSQEDIVRKLKELDGRVPVTIAFDQGEGTIYYTEKLSQDEIAYSARIIPVNLIEDYSAEDGTMLALSEFVDIKFDDIEHVTVHREPEYRM